MCYVSIKAHKAKTDRITMFHSWNLSIILRRCVLWSLLVKQQQQKWGSGLSDFPKVICVARGRVRKQAHVVLIKKKLHAFTYKTKGLQDLFLPWIFILSLEYNELICVCLPRMLGLLCSNMVGLLSHIEATDPCTGAKYDLYMSYSREKRGLRQDPGRRPKRASPGKVERLASCWVS